MTARINATSARKTATNKKSAARKSPARSKAAAPKSAARKSPARSKADAGVKAPAQEAQQLLTDLGLIEVSQKRCELWIGLDLSDKTSDFCVIDADGKVIERGKIKNRAKDMALFAGRFAGAQLALECGSQAWIPEVLAEHGLDVTVCDPGCLSDLLRLGRKNDRNDAEALARRLRADPEMLRPVTPKSPEQRLELSVVRMRETMVNARVALVQLARAKAKEFGVLLAACETDQMSQELEMVDGPLGEVLGYLKPTLDAITATIEELDQKIEEMAVKHQGTKRMTQVNGVGNLTALTLCLVLGEAGRFLKSRDVGAYLGLVPRQMQSGLSSPNLGISRRGDRYMRVLLVQCAHVILQDRAKDSDLKRYGARVMARNGGNRKKAAVAVARKLAVLLHRLWVSGEKYEPLRNTLKNAA